MTPSTSIGELRRAAESGDPQAQDNLGLCYARGEDVAQDHVEAVKWFALSAKQGFAWGQYHLGFSYEEGHGVGRDPEKAAQWFRLAADQGLLQAQNDLGMCYEKGLGVRKQVAEAVRLYRCAAERGHDGAQYNLTMCYLEGIGVPQDHEAAHRWLRLASDQQCEEAVTALAELERGTRRESFGGDSSEASDPPEQPAYEHENPAQPAVAVDARSRFFSFKRGAANSEPSPETSRLVGGWARWPRF